MFFSTIEFTEQLGASPRCVTVSTNLFLESEIHNKLGVRHIIFKVYSHLNTFCRYIIHISDNLRDEDVLNEYNSESDFEKYLYQNSIPLVLKEMIVDIEYILVASNVEVYKLLLNFIGNGKLY